MAQTIQGRSINEEHFANLVAIAYADNLLSDEEKTFLSERAEDYGLDKAEVENLINKADELKFIVPLNQEEKEDQLTDIVYMAMIDGEVHEKEYNLCLHIAQKLDYTKEELDKVIELTRKLWKVQISGQN